MSYKVKKGDTLSGIAKAHNMSLDELLKLNGISKDKANHISVGQNIKISKSTSSSTNAPNPKDKTETTSSENYTVVSGDSWSRIASKYGMSAQELAELNGSTTKTVIHPGQKLKTTKPALVSKSKTALSETATKQSSTTSNKFNTYITWTPTHKSGEDCGVDGCAQYANDTLRGHKDSKGRHLYSWDTTGGDAWTRLSRGSAKMVYSGYDSADYDRTQYSNAASDRRNFAAADKLLKEFDSRTLDPNKTYMVNMFYKGSPARKEAWEKSEGGTTGTHTGNLYFNKDTGRWHVSHNIHGTVYDDDFIKIQGSKGRYGVTAIAEAIPISYYEQDKRADYRRRKPVRGWIRDTFNAWDFMMRNGGALISKAKSGMKTPTSEEEIETDIEPAVITHIDQRPFRGDAKRFVRGVNSRRNYYMRKYGMTDKEFSDMAAMAVNVAKHESNFGNSERYKLKQYTPDFLIGLGKLVTQGYVDAPSRGFTQIKYQDDVTNPELKVIYQREGVTDDNIQDSPEKMARATLGRLHYIQGQMQPVYHYSDGTIMQPEVAQYIYWNAGRLTDGANRNISDLEADGYTGRARRFYNNRVVK